MSGDLKDPKKSIPLGTLSAMGVTTILYLLFALLLGATCARSALQNDYMIAERVGILFLYLVGTRQNYTSPIDEKVELAVPNCLSTTRTCGINSKK